MSQLDTYINQGAGEILIYQDPYSRALLTFTAPFTAVSKPEILVSQDLPAYDGSPLDYNGARELSDILDEVQEFLTEESKEYEITLSRNWNQESDWVDNRVLHFPLEVKPK